MELRREHMENEVKSVKQEAVINWRRTIFIALIHAGAGAAFFFCSWQAVVTAVLLYWIAGSLGVGMGYHRLLTHRGYKVPKVVEYLLTLFGTLALEGGPIDWVTTHRIHHARTDKEGDPHSPRDGRWWSHMGWVLASNGNQYNEALLSRYVPDLVKDRFYVWLNRFHLVPLIILGLGLLVFGGWGVLMWGVFLRITIGLHATWLVNSATHMWGRQRFMTGDDSCNSWWVALLTFGEGWHNNHHAYPSSARHGLAWYEIDFNWWGIRVLQLLGLAKSVKYVRLNTARRIEVQGS